MHGQVKRKYLPLVSAALPNSNITGQGGLILIMMLFITMLVSIMVVGLLNEQWFTVLRVRYAIDLLQAKEYALGGETYARQILTRDFVEEDTQARTDSRHDRWGEEKLSFPIEYGSVEIRIDDLQGLFNINSVADKIGHKQFRNLLNSLFLDVGLADRVRDWIDGDDQIVGLGAESADYLSLSTPFRAADQNFISLSELHILSDISSDKLAVLMDKLAVLPVTEAPLVNINTADPLVLKAIEPALSLVRAESIANQSVAFATVADALEKYDELHAVKAQLTTRSDFFRIRVKCHYRKQRYTVVSSVYRNPKTGRIRIISRSLNGDGLGFDIHSKTIHD